MMFLVNTEVCRCLLDTTVPTAGNPKPDSECANKCMGDATMTLACGAASPKEYHALYELTY